MSKKKIVISKKIILYVSFSLLFALLSFLSYNPSLVSNDREQVSLVIEKQSPKNNTELEKQSPQTDKKKESSIVEKHNISYKVDILPVKSLSSNYIIILGTFRKKNNAIGLCQQMLEGGCKDCKVIYNGTSLYWVIYNSYMNKISALKELNEQKLDGWIKKIN